MEKTFDLTIFGATGFTGKFILTEVLKTADRAFPNAPLRVAIAGRSRERLEALVASLPTGSKIQPTILIADVKDEASMRAMCKASKTLIAAAGPFRFLGEAAVAACVEEKCHYVDITGEPEFFEGMALKYHDKAKENQVAIVHVCGFDSIPADMGVLFTKQQLEKNHSALPSSIEMFFKIHSGNSGFAGHYATYESVSTMVITTLGLFCLWTNVCMGRGICRLCMDLEVLACCASFAEPPTALRSPRLVTAWQ